MPKAVVLLSGGLDSTTTLAIAKNEGYEPYTMTFRYGQRHDVEIQCAQKIAQQFGVQDHVIVDIDLRSFGGSALTGDFDVLDQNIKVIDVGRISCWPKVCHGMKLGIEGVVECK